MSHASAMTAVAALGDGITAEAAAAYALGYVAGASSSSAAAAPSDVSSTGSTGSTSSSSSAASAPLPAILLQPHFTTMITTASYIPGVMVLYHTLKRFSAYPLVVYTTSQLDIPAEVVQLNIFEVTKNFRAAGGEDDAEERPDHEFHPTDLSATSFVDAPRRLLFLLPIPIVFLDADLLILSKSIDALIELCAGAEQCYAVGNYRNKKATFNDPPSALAANSVKSANFNSGVMVVPYDEARFKHLYTESCRMLRNGYDDTEEKLLNVLFEGAWRPLPVGYNLQKRCFVGNPSLWNSVVDGGNGYSSAAVECAVPVGPVCVVHYVGGKPWQSVEELTVLDYEEDGSGAVERKYGVLFEAWRTAGTEVPRAPLP